MKQVCIATAFAGLAIFHAEGQTGQRLFYLGDSLFQSDQYADAALHFLKAGQQFRTGDTLDLLRAMDAERIARESIAEWSKALDLARAASKINRDAFQGRLAFSDIAFPHSPAWLVDAQYISYLIQLLEVQKEWKGYESHASRQNWILTAGSELLQTTVVEAIEQQLRRDYMSDTSRTNVLSRLKWLANYSLPWKSISSSEISVLETNGRQYLLKATGDRDSTLINLFRAARYFAMAGVLNPDSLVLPYVQSWKARTGNTREYDAFLGWYFENKNDFDQAGKYYGEDHAAFLVRKAAAYKKGLLPRKTARIQDTLKANGYFRDASGHFRKKRYYEAFARWGDALRIYQSFDCWDRVMVSLQNRTVALYYWNRESVSVTTFDDFEETAQLAIALFREGSSQTAAVHRVLGGLYRDAREHALALQHFKLAMNYYEQSAESEVLLLGQLQVAAAEESDGVGDQEAAVEFYEKARIGLESLPAGKYKQFQPLYAGLSRAYFETGNYDQALLYLDRAVRAASGRDDLLEARTRLQRGSILESQAKETEALSTFRSAIQRLPVKQYHLANEEAERVRMSGATGEKAYSKVFKYSDTHGDDINLRLQLLHAIVAWKNRHHQEVQPELGEIRSIVDNPFIRDKSIEVLIDMHNLLAAFGSDSVALEDASRAISLNFINRVDDFTEAEWNNPPLGLRSDPSIDAYLDGIQLVDSYVARGSRRYAIYQRTHQQEDLDAARHDILKCDSIFTRARNLYTSQRSKLRLSELSQRVYVLGVAISIASQDPYRRDDAFYFIEKGKSSTLRESISDVKARYFSGIPDSLQLMEKRLNEEIFNTQRNLADKVGNSDSAISRLYTLNRTREALMQRLETEYPQYFRLKHQEFIPDRFDLHRLIEGDEALVSFLMGEHQVFAAVFDTARSFRYFMLPRDSLLEKYTRAFRTSIIHEATEEFVYYSTWLYQHLFGEVDRYLSQNKGIRKVIIVPDGILGYIPFEALVPASNEKALQDLPYLVTKYEIRYTYAASLLVDDATPLGPISADSAFIALAPVFKHGNRTNFQVKSCERFYEDTQYESQTSRAFSRDGRYITPLPGTENEIRGIEDRLREAGLFGQYFLFRNAREEVLKSPELRKYRYIHLATHGIINDHLPDASGLLMSQDSLGGEDGILYASEIYSIRINADLVTLSACETGLGRIVRGEGIIGLTRGWLYAGARNVVVSLWKVADASTSGFMIEFYDHLLRGTPKAASLHRAKLSMIQGKKYASPYYWAPFILVGK